jgi:aldose 1-epimerase
MKQYIIAITFLLSSLSCQNNRDKSVSEAGSFFKYADMKESDFQTSFKGSEIQLFKLKNGNGLEMEVTNFGARVISLYVPDRNGDFEDIALGHDNIQDYIDHPNTFFGAPVGRYANRISGAKFSLNGVTYPLEANNGTNSIHGGRDGFHNVVWTVEEVSRQKIIFSYLSKDGEGGFPGTLSVRMSYALTDKDEFEIQYEAETDKSTVVNLTHHSYFNLHGAGKGNVTDHILWIHADHYTPVDSLLIPTGEIIPVKATPLDFTIPKRIGERIDDEHEQLKLAQGYDHNWVLNKKETKQGVSLAVEIWVPNGRKMSVYTTEPGIQIYTGNFLNDVKGKGDEVYSRRGGICLETQHFPDSPNKPDFPSVILNPNEKYNQTTIYKFAIDESGYK